MALNEVNKDNMKNKTTSYKDIRERGVEVVIVELIDKLEKLNKKIDELFANNVNNEEPAYEVISDEERYPMVPSNDWVVDWKWHDMPTTLGHYGGKLPNGCIVNVSRQEDSTWQVSWDLFDVTDEEMDNYVFFSVFNYTKPLLMYVVELELFKRGLMETESNT